MSTRKFTLSPTLHLVAKDEQGTAKDYLFAAPEISLSLDGEAALLVDPSWSVFQELLEKLSPRLQVRTSRHGGFSSVPFRLVAVGEAQEEPAEKSESPVTTAFNT